MLHVCIRLIGCILNVNGMYVIVMYLENECMIKNNIPTEKMPTIVFHLNEDNKISSKIYEHIIIMTLFSSNSINH